MDKTKSIHEDFQSQSLNTGAKALANSIAKRNEIVS